MVKIIEIVERWIKRLTILSIIAIWLFVMLLTYANALDATNLVYWHTFDTTEINVNEFKDLVQNYNFTNAGTTGITESYLSQARYFDGSDHYINMNDYPGFDITTQNLTFGFWVRLNSSSGASVLLIQFAGSDYLQIYIDWNANNIEFQLDEVGSADTCQVHAPIGSLANGQPHLLLFMRNGTACSVNADTFMFLDNTKLTLSAVSVVNQVTSFSPTTNYIGIGSNAIAYDYKGNMNDIFRYDRALSYQERMDIYNGGSGVEYPFTTPQANLSLQTSLINNTMYYNFPTLNFTYNGTVQNYGVDVMNCTFFKQGQVDTTLLNVNLSINNKYNISLPETNDIFNISFNCSDAVVNASSGWYYYLLNLTPVAPGTPSNTTEELIYMKLEDMESDFNMLIFILLNMGFVFVGAELSGHKHYLLGMGLIIGSVILDFWLWRFFEATYPYVSIFFFVIGIAKLIYTVYLGTKLR